MKQQNGSGGAVVSFTTKPSSGSITVTGKNLADDALRFAVHEHEHLWFAAIAIAAVHLHRRTSNNAARIKRGMMRHRLWSDTKAGQPPIGSGALLSVAASAMTSSTTPMGMFIAASA